MGKTIDLTPRKIAEVKTLNGTEIYSNRKFFGKLNVSELSVRRIKKKLNFGQDLNPLRKKKCGRKPIFTPRAERCLAKICL